MAADYITKYYLISEMELLRNLPTFFLILE